MGRTIGYAPDHSRLERGTVTYSTLALALEYKRACRASIGSLSESLDRYTSLPLVAETAGREQVKAPVARLPTEVARHWRWSSARAHLAGHDDLLVKVRPMLKRRPDWRELLTLGVEDPDAVLIRLHTRTGRLLGEKTFVTVAERKLHRSLTPQKRGPMPRAKR